LDLITTQNGYNLENRKLLATKAFHVSSHYDAAIFNYSIQTKQFTKKVLLMVKFKYGENPHQKAFFLILMPCLKKFMEKNFI
jgi:phosphoribosylaminoimidazolecarboxamide formyltransferase/IMP cyclohydrolase